MIRLAFSLIIALVASPALRAADAPTDEERKAVLGKAYDFLKSKQADDGGYLPKFGPGVTALAASALGEGVARPRDLITTAIGPGYAADVTATYGRYLGHSSAIVTVRTPLPLIGLFGIGGGLEVAGHAAVETIP